LTPSHNRPRTAGGLHDILPRILPFCCYMVFIAAREVSVLFSGMSDKLTDTVSFIYPVQIAIVVAALCYAVPRCPELSLRDVGLSGSRGRNTLFSAATGVAVFAIWIHLDLPWARIGTPAGFSPDIAEPGLPRNALLAVRLAGATLVVPVMEELFWRSFLIRYIRKPDFTSVPAGSLHWPSFCAVALLFGLEHHLVVAGIIAGIAYNIVLIRTGSIMQCVLSHAVTNGMLGVWVILTGSWSFW